MKAEVTVPFYTSSRRTGTIIALREEGGTQKVVVLREAVSPSGGG